MYDREEEKTIRWCIPNVGDSTLTIQNPLGIDYNGVSETNFVQSIFVIVVSIFVIVVSVFVIVISIFVIVVSFFVIVITIFIMSILIFVHLHVFSHTPCFNFCHCRFNL